MAVQRESRAVGPLANGAVQDVQVGRGRGAKQPNFRKFENGISTSDVLLDAVATTGTKLAGQAWEAQKEDAYINGVRQAARRESEVDLEASPFMRDWASAGFRDTKGRLAQADFSTELPDAIREALSKPDPQAAFDVWLNRAQSKLTSQYSGMSRKARAAMFAQNATDVHAAQRAFTKEYAASGIAQQDHALRADFTARRTRLDASKNDAKAYAAESQAFAGAVYTNIWLNDRLPMENKIALTSEAIEYAASTNNVQVYNLLKNQKYDLGGKEPQTIMQQIPLPEQIKLDKAYTGAMDKMKTVRAVEWSNQKAVYESAFSDKTSGVPDMPWSDYQEFLLTGVDEGFLDRGSYEAAAEKYFTAARRGGQEHELAQRALAGDWAGIFKAGADDADVVKALYTSTKGESWEYTAQSMLTACQKGSGGACQAYGDLIAPSIATLGYSEEIDPNTAAMAHQFIQGISEASKTNPGAQVHMLKGLPSEAQDMVLAMRDMMEDRKIADPQVAIAQARKLVQQTSSPAMQDMRRTNAAADNLAVQDIEEKQLWETLKWGIQFLSADASNRSAITPGRFWFENEDRVAHNAATSKLVLSEALQRVNRTSPWLSHSARQSKALAMTAAQQVPTESGPVFFPFGHTAHSYFGAPADANPEDIGRALDKLVPLEDGQRIAWDGNALTTGAPLLYTIYDADGNPGPSRMMNPKDVGVRTQELIKEEVQEQMGLTGPGKVVRKGGAQVQFNGENTAGVSPHTMVALREDLVNHEGIRTNQYSDGSVVQGNKAFGVGISQTGDFFEAPHRPDGTYSQAQIDRTFLAASNQAAETAANTMRKVGLEGAEWVRFFGDVAYQSPASARNSDMLAHIQLGNTEQAIEAFRNTAAYKALGKTAEERAAHPRNVARINLLKKAMK